KRVHARLRHAMAVRCRAGAQLFSLNRGPGSAKQREERCIAPGTQNNQLNIASISSCDAWPASPASFGPLSRRAAPTRASVAAGARALVAAWSALVVSMSTNWGLMNLLVAISLMMALPVRTLKLQAPLAQTTLTK